MDTDVIVRFMVGNFADTLNKRLERIEGFQYVAGPLEALENLKPPRHSHISNHDFHHAPPYNSILNPSPSPSHSPEPLPLSSRFSFTNRTSSPAHPDTSHTQIRHDHTNAQAFSIPPLPPFPSFTERSTHFSSTNSLKFRTNTPTLPTPPSCRPRWKKATADVLFVSLEELYGPEVVWAADSIADGRLVVLGVPGWGARSSCMARRVELRVRTQPN